MKVYMLYLTVPEDIFQTKLKYLIGSVEKLNFRLKEGNAIVLYGWTSKKKHLKRFLDERCSEVFSIKTKEFNDEEDYEEFAYNNAKLELMIGEIGLSPACDGYERLANDENDSIIDKENFTKMVMTKFESENIGLYRSENMNEFGPSAYADMDYCIFKDEIIAALKVLGYVTLYDSSYSQYFPTSEDRLRKYEEAMDVINLLDMDSDLITPLIKTEYVSFIYLYSYTFIGK